MPYYFPFGQQLRPLIQEDTTPKKVFVLGVYASAVHARWKKDGQVICQALAVASEPRIFWDGDPEEAKRIINAIDIPKELGTLEPAGRQLNGPSAKVLDENILAPLGFTRVDAWLCDCLPETRINPSQAKALRQHRFCVTESRFYSGFFRTLHFQLKYHKLMKKYRNSLFYSFKNLFVTVSTVLK